MKIFDAKTTGANFRWETDRKTYEQFKGKGKGYEFSYSNKGKGKGHQHTFHEKGRKESWYNQSIYEWHGEINPEYAILLIFG